MRNNPLKNESSVLLNEKWLKKIVVEIITVRDEAIFNKNHPPLFEFYIKQMGNIQYTIHNYLSTSTQLLLLNRG